MGDYQGISGTIFDEPEYDEPIELVVMIYLMATRDMAGVCSIHPQVSAAKCRTSVTKFKKIIELFAKIGKLIISENETHIWLKAGIWHSLYKGKCSDTQAKSVGGSLRKWQSSHVFGNNFAEVVLQHYDTKYNYSIPYPLPPAYPGVGSYQSQSQSESQSQTETETQAQSGEIGSAYFKKFGKNLKKEDGESLLRKYGDKELLLMMIRHITINSKIKSPVGLLMIARDAPGSHLPDDQYDNWKREIRNVESRDS